MVCVFCTYAPPTNPSVAMLMQTEGATVQNEGKRKVEREIKYTYDKNGRLTLYANNERNDRISFQYNKQGYLSNITDSSYSYQISRDENRLITNVLILHRGGYFSDTTLEFEYY